MTPEAASQPRDSIDISVGDFAELLKRKDVVYHGIGSDFIALSGVSQHGILSANELSRQELWNSNTPRDKAYNGDDSVSVARQPELGTPTAAFDTYIDRSPVSFVIDAEGIETFQPSKRGFFDEAFIFGADLSRIIGVVVADEMADKPFASPVKLEERTSIELIPEKIQHLLNWLEQQGVPENDITSYMHTFGEVMDEIKHINTTYLQNQFGVLTDRDNQALTAASQLYTEILRQALHWQLGNADITVLELVKTYFPQIPVYRNDHHTAPSMTESEYFDLLQLDKEIGYEKWDGTNEDPSYAKLRRKLLSTFIGE